MACKFAKHASCIDWLASRLDRFVEQQSHHSLRLSWCAPSLVEAPVMAVTLGAGGQRVSWKCWMAATARSQSVRQGFRVKGH